MATQKNEYESVKLAYDLFTPSKDEDISLSPVILLHGMASSRKTWVTIAQTIADATKRKVYALDARNHGESDWTKKFNYDVMAKDVENFMDGANISKAVLVGHSMGGKTGMVLALSKPEKVDKLLVEDISPKPLSSHWSPIGIQYLKLLRQSLSELPEGCNLETAKTIIALYIVAHVPAEYRFRKKSADAMNTLPLKMTEKGVAWQANLEVIEDVYVNTNELRKELNGQYNGETLFIYGTKSPYEVYEAKDTIMKLFPKAVFSAVRDGSHFIHMELPEDFCAKVVEFIGRKQ